MVFLFMAKKKWTLTNGEFQQAFDEDGEILKHENFLQREHLYLVTERKAYEAVFYKQSSCGGDDDLPLVFVVMEEDSSIGTELCEKLKDEEEKVLITRKKKRKKGCNKDMQHNIEDDSSENFSEEIYFSGKTKKGGSVNFALFYFEDYKEEVEDVPLALSGKEKKSSIYSRKEVLNRLLLFIEETETSTCKPDDDVTADEEIPEITFSGKKKSVRKKSRSVDLGGESMLGREVTEESNNDKNSATKGDEVGETSKSKKKKKNKNGRTGHEEDDFDKILAEFGDTPISPVSKVKTQHEQVAPADDSGAKDGEEESVESAATKKKKRKKDKKATVYVATSSVEAKENKQETSTSEPSQPEKKDTKGKVVKKKVPKHVREMQEILVRRQEAEQRKKKEEEEKLRKEEEERHMQEEQEKEAEEIRQKRKIKKKKKVFEQKKKLGKEHILSLKETTEKEIEHVQVELKRLDAERFEIKLDRERREIEWAELKDSVEELKVQREKLEMQRFLLRAEKEKLRHEIKKLKKLENLKVGLDDMSMAKMQLPNLETSWEKVSPLKQKVVTRDDELDMQNGVSTESNSEDVYNSSMKGQNGSTPSSDTPVSWIKRHTNLTFKTSPEKSSLMHQYEEGGGLPLEKMKLDSLKSEEEAYTEGLSITIERLEAGKKKKGNTFGNKNSKPSNNKKRKHDVIKKSSDEVDIQSVISSPQNVPKDKHELPSSQTQMASGVVVISETVKITKVTCEAEVTNKVITLDCSENNSEAEKKMGEDNQDTNCNHAVCERESSLLKRKQDLCVAEGKISSKESELIHKILANEEIIPRKRKYDVKVDLESKCKVVDDEIESKRQASKVRDVDITQKEDLLAEKEHDLEEQSRALAEKDEDITERSYILDKKEKNLNATENDINLKTTLLGNEKERLRKLDLDLQQYLKSLEDKRKRVDYETQKLEALKNETSELSTMEMKLKEELDDLKIDVVLVNGVLHQDDQIVVCGSPGPIVIDIKALLTPHPMKGKYLHHEEVKAAQGIKIIAQGLEHAIGSLESLFVFLKSPRLVYLWPTRFNGVRDAKEVENFLREVVHVSGNEHKAHVLTKALGGVKFKEMRDLFGVQDLLRNEFKLKGENVGLSLKLA